VTKVPAQATPLRPVPPDARMDVRALLDATEALPPAEGVDALAAELAEQVGASQVSVLIAEISGLTLARLARRPADGRDGSGRRTGGQVPIHGTPAGRALTLQRTQVVSGRDGVRVHVPVSERGEAIGVLELLLPETPGTQVLEYLGSAGHVLAYVIIADRRFTDLYELGQRSTVLSLEAEIQRRLLPTSYACEGPQFALAGWLVPADDAGGDSFDYVVDRSTLHLSITDAMGHGVPAAQLATLAVGSLRNSRRRGLGLTEQAQRASTHIAEHAAPDQFVTGLLGRLDLQTGALELVNAGHLNPLLVRDGRVEEMLLDAGLVLGVEPDEPYPVQHFQLRPGDRLALVTDGMSERDAAEAEIELLLATLGHLHPREAVQALTAAVLQVTAGAVRDDATVLLVDWYGGS
jgi:serine phosphatase RsbU (regulator of sigma subunit)